jgi:hypothetical protein
MTLPKRTISMRELLTLIALPVVISLGIFVIGFLLGMWVEGKKQIIEIDTSKLKSEMKSEIMAECLDKVLLLNDSRRQLQEKADTQLDLLREQRDKFGITHEMLKALRDEIAGLGKCPKKGK